MAHELRERERSSTEEAQQLQAAFFDEKGHLKAKVSELEEELDAVNREADFYKKSTEKALDANGAKFEHMEVELGIKTEEVSALVSQARASDE